MKDKIIEICISRLINNKSNDIGLFTGETGKCLSLSFYYHTKYWQCCNLETVLDDLMQRIVRNIHELKSTDFDKGLSGIGFAMSFLVKSGHLQIESNQTLFPLDAMIYRHFFDESNLMRLGCTNGILGYLFYALSRLNLFSNDTDDVLKRLELALTRECINKISEIFPLHYVSLYKDIHTSILYEVPLLFVALRKCIDKGISVHQISCLMLNWEIYIKAIVPYYNINKLYLAVSLLYLNQKLHCSWIQDYAMSLVYFVNYDCLVEEIDERINNVNEGWFFYCLILYYGEKLVSSTHPKYACLRNTRKAIILIHLPKFEQQCSDESRVMDLSLIQGLAGVLMLYALCPQCIDMNS